MCLLHSAVAGQDGPDLLVLNAGERGCPSQSGPVATQRVCGDPCAEEMRGSVGVASLPQENAQCSLVLVLGRQSQCCLRLVPTTIASKCQEPRTVVLRAEADALLLDLNTALRQQFFHILIAQRDAQVQPDRMADHRIRKLAPPIQYGLGRHSGAPGSDQYKPTGCSL